MGVRPGEKGPLGEHRAEERDLCVDDHRAGPAQGGEQFGGEVLEPEFFGPSGLEHPEPRQAHRDMGDRRGDVVRRDRSQQQRWHVHTVGPGTGRRGGVHGLVERCGAHQGVRNAGAPRQVLLRRLGPEVARPDRSAPTTDSAT